MSATELLILTPTMVRLLGEARMQQLSAVFDVRTGKEKRGPKVKGPSDRDFAMADLYRAGQTMEQIGNRYGLTRERVRQILTGRFAITGNDRGGVTKAKAERAERARHRAQAKESSCLQRFDLSLDERNALRKINREMADAGLVFRAPTYAFTIQRNNAKRRNIPWCLTLGEWWSIWDASGKWSERGRHGYGLLRFGDTGPFAIGNVFVGRRGRGLKATTAARANHSLEAAA